ncbi:MAG: phosphate acyltransferase PlsX [Parafilimonas sp.]
MNIALDMMGGDFAPLEAVKGLHFYFNGKNDNSGVTIICIGDEARLSPVLSKHNLTSANIQIIHAPEIIDYHESPTKALKEKPNSSISIGFHLLATGKVDAFVSAGNTGAMLVGSMFIIKPIKGVQRPTIATLIPKVNGETCLLLDVGLNTDCKPQHLEQFAVLGSLYAQNILNINKPRVALLNIGEEEGKGDLLSQSAYPLLKNNNRIHFIGNTEGRHVLQNHSDVIVCDGFTGNVILKMLESFYDIAESRQLANDEYLRRFHYQNYGGTPVLGIAKPVIIGHGISNDKAFSKMISVAEKMVETNLCNSIKDAFHTPH